MEAVFVRHLFAGSFSFLLGFYLIPLVMKIASRYNILDLPDGNIKCHKAPTPYLGGIAVYVAFVATLALAYPFENKILWLLLGTTCLLFVGLVDDLHVLRPGQKFLGQIFAVLCFLKGGVALKTTFFSSFFNMTCSAFWMLSIINAFNLIDVMDGLSSLVAIVAASSFLCIALMFQLYSISLLLLAFIGAFSAFYLFNKPPAKIYLGDAGAMFAGGFLSAIPLLFPWSAQSIDAYYTPAIILAIPIIEICSLITIRTWLGIPFYRGSPHHFAIYLQNKGWSKYHVLAFSLIMGLIFSVISFLFLLKFIALGVLILLLGTTFLSWCFIVFYHPKYRREQQPTRTLN